MRRMSQLQNSSPRKIALLASLGPSAALLAGSGKGSPKSSIFRWRGVLQLAQIIWALFILCGCSPNSSEEFQQEGKARCRSLLTDLQKIENREQLLASQPKLKKHFETMIDLIIEAREFQQKHLEEGESENDDRTNTAEADLQEELRRIYAIEGGREIVERSQQEALVRLDAYERALAKKEKRRSEALPKPKKPAFFVFSAKTKPYFLAYIIKYVLQNTILFLPKNP
jgi:hypothetical protein